MMLNKNDQKILVVEDEIIIAEYISKILKKNNFQNIRTANDEKAALEEMSSFLPDIILMDINLSGKNSGIDLAKVKNENAIIIFITGQADFALMTEAFKTNPEAYLTKPIKKVDVLAAINLAVHKKENKILQFKDGYDTIKLSFNNILYLEADGNYINIYTEFKKYTIRASLSVMFKKLPLEFFKQTHRSYIVNIYKIERVTSNSIKLNNIELPLSRSFSKAFK
jgi:two-component system response regulator LytT